MLRSVADEVWVHDDDLRLPGGMMLPSRMTIVRRGRELVVHSPLALDDALAAEIEALGEVATLVAPSAIHYLFLAPAVARWPRARVLGAPGLEKKVPEVAFDPLPPEGRVAGMPVRRVNGVPYIGEHVLLHEDTRTLIVVDLLFNMHAVRGVGMSLFLRATGTYGRPAQSRVWRFLARDRAAAGRSVAEILAWDFDRVVMAHGDVIERGGKDVVAGAVAWLAPGLRHDARQDAR